MPVWVYLEDVGDCLSRVEHQMYLFHLRFGSVVMKMYRSILIIASKLVSRELHRILIPEKNITLPCGKRR